MTKLIALLIAISSFSFSNGQKNYQISGKLEGFQPGEFIYLSDLTDGSYRKIDSTVVKKGRFSFKGALKVPITRYAIHDASFAHRTSFWIDETPVRINAQKGDFKQARIKGSRTQAENDLMSAQVDTAKSKKKAYIRFIEQHPASIVSANLLSIYSSSWNKDTVKQLYEQLIDPAKSSREGQEVFQFLALNKDIKVGDRYADFAEQTMDGQTIRLSDYEGKVVLLEFWGSWCMPCREGHPELIRTYNEFKQKGFDILGVAADVDRDQLLNAIAKDQLPWTNVSDLKGDQTQSALIYRISYYPANFLIDRNGIIVAKDLRGEKLRAKLQEMLP